jgi:hypothetical protein
MLTGSRLERIAGTRKDLWRVVFRSGKTTSWYEKRPVVDMAGEVLWLDWFAMVVAQELGVAASGDELWKFGVAMEEVVNLTPEPRLRVIEGGPERPKRLP